MSPATLLGTSMHFQSAGESHFLAWLAIPRVAGVFPRTPDRSIPKGGSDGCQ
jgi:hypothetical protein